MFCEDASLLEVVPLDLLNKKVLLEPTHRIHDHPRISFGITKLYDVVACNVALGLFVPHAGLRVYQGALLFVGHLRWHVQPSVALHLITSVHFGFRVLHSVVAWGLISLMTNSILKIRQAFRPTGVLDPENLSLPNESQGLPPEPPK